MTGYKMKLSEYMLESGIRFVVPVYQRNYNWGAGQCDQLYSDLVDTFKENRKSHFFGSIVETYDSTSRTRDFFIIDGQQRLTTISLLFLAMYHLIQRGILSLIPI